MFYGIPDLTTFVIGTIFIVLLPGPNSLYVIALASRRGIAAGYRGAGLARHFRTRRRMSAAATGSVGGLFIGFGAKLASATLG